MPRILSLFFFLNFFLSSLVLAEPKINDLQVLGTHNSYKKFLDSRLMSFAGAICETELLNPLTYEEPSLSEQAESYGVRNFELDIYADPQGGYYREHRLLSILGFDGFVDAKALDRPGYKIMHDINLDFRTVCLTLETCLKELNSWSERNPKHLPLFIQLEIIENQVDIIPGFNFLAKELGLKSPQKISSAMLVDLEVEIERVIPREKIISPGLVQKSAPTLRDAIVANQWPYLEQARGKFIFVIDARDRIRDLYLASIPSHERLLFVYFSAEEVANPDAAFMILNSPMEDNGAAKISQLVAENFIVRTRTDSDTIEAREDDTRRRDAALKSGAHMLSTDYIFAQPGTTGTDYYVSIPKGNPGRCNPIRNESSCNASVISE